MEMSNSPTLAEVALKYRSSTPVDEMPKITSPGEVVKVLRKIWDPDSIQLKEEFIVLLLNNAKRCIGWSKISSGGATATIVDPASILQVALLANAQSLVLAHNHPSGNLSASRSDIQLTRRIAEGGKLLGIPVDDHIIVTAEHYLSFKAEGLVD